MKREIRKWWNGGSIVKNFKNSCLPCTKRKRKHSGKERKEANNDIVRVHHEKKRKEKMGIRENRFE